MGGRGVAVGFGLVGAGADVGDGMGVSAGGAVGCDAVVCEGGIAVGAAARTVGVNVGYGVRVGRTGSGVGALPAAAQAAIEPATYVTSIKNTMARIFIGVCLLMGPKTAQA